MAQIKGEGIVLRATNLGEWDKLLVIFAEGRGKVKAVAKGARKIQSRYASLTQPFSHIRFTLYQGKSLHTFSQVELLEGYRSLREDLDKMAYGLYMLELVDAALVDDQPHDDILSLLIACLHILSHTARPELLLAFFELRYLSRVGFGLSVDTCPICAGRPGPKLSVEVPGFVCARCQSEGAPRAAVAISKEGLTLLKHLAGGDWRRVEALPEPALGEKEVSALLDRIVITKLEKRPESYTFLTQIRSSAR